MEIYRQRPNKVYFQLPDEGYLSKVTASLDDGPEVTLLPDDPNAAVVSASLPFIPNEGTVRVNWTFMAETFNGFEDSTVTRTYDVVSPILSRTEIKAIHPNATPDEVDLVERAVRHVINAHTGQRFGLFVGTRTVSGTGGKAMLLPERLLSLSKVDGLPAKRSGFTVDSTGYILRGRTPYAPSLKADYDGYHYHTGGVIHNPNNVQSVQFSTSRQYEIEGQWGWTEVPSQVKEAAKLLVNDYACADQAYRDRFLYSMTAADWRISFTSGAFIHTGNARANLLLSDYVLQRGWTVV